MEEAIVVRGKITGGIACGVIAGLSGLVSALVVVAGLGGLNNPEDNLFCAALGFIPASLIGAFVGMLAWSTGSKRQHVVGLLIATVLGLVAGALSLFGLFSILYRQQHGRLSIWRVIAVVVGHVEPTAPPDRLHD